MLTFKGAGRVAGAGRRGVSRLIGALALAGTPAVIAATPASGTLTATSGDLTYEAGPFVVANPLGFATGVPLCLTAIPGSCDSYKLTVTLPEDYRSQYPGAAVVITLGWEPAAGEIPVPGVATLPDYDLFIYQGDVGNTIGGDLLIASFGTTPIETAATADNPEIARIAAKNGTNVYTIKSVPFAPTGETIAVRVSLDPGAPASGGGGGGGGGSGGGGEPAPLFGDGDVAGVDKARYQIFRAPAGSSAESDGGEYSIGFNPATQRIMTMSIGFPGPVWRLTPPEVLDPNAPESGEALWEDKSSLWKSVPQVVSDPILYTDPETGRTHAANLTVGPNISYAFSDDDGETWTNVGTGIAGADHETVVSGPYPPDSPYEDLAKLAGYVDADGNGHAVYFCSQDVVGPGGCTRSDDGGLIWGPMQIAYDGTMCGGLHGHLRIAPDGSAYLPIKDCGDKQGGSFTTDAGDTWTQFQVPGTVPQANGSDPSIAVDDANTLYFCYVNGDGHARVKVGHRNGDTLVWDRDTDIGISHGVTNATFPEAIAGDPGRAACGFLGTNDPSPNYQSRDFDGIWYLFIATTTDGGQTWTTVNATPNDPVQGAGGIWQQGGSGDGNGNRNLLDFNEITLDDKGRVLFGYNDGCVTNACLTDPSNNDFVAHQRVARQTGGKTLRAAFDTEFATLRKPGRPTLSAASSPQGLLLSWKVPDHGGSDITGYVVTKTAADNTQQTFEVTGKTTYLDTAADAATASYVVAARNTIGSSDASNRFSASGAPVSGGTACAVPGLTVATDAAGDDNPPLPTAADGQGDILSVGIAEPKALAGKLVFTMKVGSLETLPPNVNWYVIFFDPSGKKWFVAMQTDETSTPSYSYGDYGTNENISNTLGDADALSGYNAATGEIRLVVAKSLVGNVAAGQKLNNVQGVTYQLVGSSLVGGSLQTIDQSSTGSYTLRAADACDANTPPDATLSATPLTGSAPLAVTFTVGLSDADAGDTLGYSLDFGDGSSPATGSAPGTVNHTYSSTGLKTAVLTVTDSAGASDTAAVSIQVNGAGGALAVGLSATYNKTRNADGTYPTSESDPLVVTFTASGSGGAGSGYKYTFNFGDGTHAGPQTSATATHEYRYASQDGYHAKVVVTDADQTQSAMSDEIVIRTSTEVVVSGDTQIDLSVSPTSGTAPVTVTAVANGPNARHAAGTATTEYVFDFGDDSAVVTNASGSASHVYTIPEARTYTISVTMTDKSSSGAVLGTSSATASVAVNSGNRLTALLSINPTAVRVGQTVTFDGCSSFTSDDATITKYVLDPDGDGALAAIDGGATCTFSYAYASAGTYTPTLTVTDSTSATAKVSAGTVSVTPTVPGTDDGTGGGVTRRANGGGGLGWLTLAPLLMAVARRRRVTLH